MKVTQIAPWAARFPYMTARPKELYGLPRPYEVRGHASQGLLLYAGKTRRSC